MFYHTLPLRYSAIEIFNHRRERFSTIVETRSQRRLTRMSHEQGQGVQPQAQAPPVGAAPSCSRTAYIRIRTRARQCTLGLQQHITYQDILQGCYTTQT